MPQPTRPIRFGDPSADSTSEPTGEFLRRLASRVESADSLQSAYLNWLASIKDFVGGRGISFRWRDESGMWRELRQGDFPILELGSETNPTRHGTLVFEAFNDGQPKIIGVGGRKDEAGRFLDPDANPTDGQLILMPLATAQRQGVITVLMSTVVATDQQAAVLRLTRQAMPLLAAAEQREFNRLREKLNCADALDKFAQDIHRELSRRYVAYVAANEGKRLIGCDRVAVLLRHGDRYRLEAVSGLDIVESRSQAAKLLRVLVRTTCEVGEILRYPSSNRKDWTPPVRDALESYVDATHVRSLAVIPIALTKSSPSDDPKSTAPLGALVVEHFASAEQVTIHLERGRFLAQHIAAAVANAQAYEAIPLLPLWRQLAQTTTRCFAPGTRKRTYAILATIAVLLISLVAVPADFSISCQAVLRPTVERSAFAPADGVVKRVLVRHGDVVAAGQPLLEIQNTDLEVSLADVAGQRAAANEQLVAVERSLFEDGARLGIQDRHRLSGQRRELRQKLVSLDEQLEVLRRKRDQLTIRSPVAGEITTWNVEELLTQRPVRVGQQLLQIGETTGPWKLELRIPEDDVGHVIRAEQMASEPLAVNFRLASAPAVDYSGRVDEIHLAAEVRGDEGNTVLARCDLDRPPPSRRAGAAAVAKIQCGRRSLGYVWLHDAVDFLRTKVLFRLS